MLKPSFSKQDEDDLDLELKEISQFSEEFDDDEDGYTNVNPINNIERTIYLKQDENKFSSIRSRTLSDLKRDFQLGDIIEFVHNGLDVNTFTFYFIIYSLNLVNFQGYCR